MEEHFSKVMSCLFVLSLLLWSSPLVTATTEKYNHIGPNYGIKTLNRTSFPKGFIFGMSASAFQFEGAAREDGRTPSVWDTFMHEHPEKIADGSNADVTIDFYHRYKEDVKIMKDMNLDIYRFAISWSRVLPHGKLSRGVNPKGIQYYHNFIDELLANGIQPVVTLFHWDLPQILEDEYGGFLSLNIVEDFRNYVDLCFREYGDKVKMWITQMEPSSYSSAGYASGMFAPNHCSEWQNLNCTSGDSGTEPYIVAHHLLLAHASAVEVYRQKYQKTQKGKIGITLISYWMEPYSNTRHGRNAAQRAFDFMLGWFMDPMTKGDYPYIMRKLVGNRLPKFTKEQSASLIGSFDFIGLNYYSAYYAAYAPSFRTARPNYFTDSLVNLTASRNGKLIGRQAASPWLYVYPKGLRGLLLYIKKTYNNPIIYITENGLDEVNDDFHNKLTLKEELQDAHRVDFYHEHLTYLQQAIKEGVDVRGYFAWALLDNIEWHLGFTVRWGMNYVDYKNGLKRYPKLSAKWYKNFLKKC